MAHVAHRNTHGGTSSELSAAAWLDLFYGSAVAEVRLRIYSLTKRSFMYQVNKALRKAGVGVWHAGVEIHGREWSYAAGGDSGSGIRDFDPGCDPDHEHYEAIHMGQLRCTMSEVRDIVHDMAPEWQVSSYDTINHNCVHFVDAFLKKLGHEGAPDWLMRSTGIAAAVMQSPIGRLRSCRVRAVSHSSTSAQNFEDSGNEKHLDSDGSTRADADSEEEICVRSVFPSTQ